jgi:MerR family copper efflux transcriptional regulator
MTPGPPIACSLDADEREDRLRQIRAVGRDSLLSVSPEGSLRFRADEATRERVQDVIAAESHCCPFLDFDLREDGGELVLTVSAPDGAEPLALDLIGAFAGLADAAGR